MHNHKEGRMANNRSLLAAALASRNTAQTRTFGFSPLTKLTMAPGQLEPGTIDLHNRPVVPNLDGSISTVRSVTVTDNQGRAYLIPTVIKDPRYPGGGRVVSGQQALQHFQQTGQHLGVFKNEAAADRYAESLHNEQAREYLPKRK